MTQQTYVLVDTLNMFYRSRHVVRASDIETKIGMSLHIMFASINKSYKDFNGSHVVFCMDRSSWRKQAYAPYKRNRKVARAALTETELEEDEMFFAALNDFKAFLAEKTNCTVLEADKCEADDFVARWIQSHPNDKHVIVSTDTDFYQLLTDDVSQYNGVQNRHITVNGIFDDRGKPIIDKTTKQPLVLESPEWLLFEKCVRGDKSDNIFSAYPGCRKKGTKNKIGMLEAFADRHKKGFDWNNFMLQKWTDHEDKEHRVLDDYHRNCEIIDLTKQPEEIKSVLDAVIIEAVQKEKVSQVGTKFLKFCGKYDLVRVSDKATEHASYLTAGYIP